MSTAQLVFVGVLCGGATGSHVTGSDVSHVTGSRVTGALSGSMFTASDTTIIQLIHGNSVLKYVRHNDVIACEIK
jgi:hypothetical protein